MGPMANVRTAKATPIVLDGEHALVLHGAGAGARCGHVGSSGGILDLEALQRPARMVFVCPSEYRSVQTLDYTDGWFLSLSDRAN